MYRTVFDREEIPADIREFFEETSSQCGKPWVRVTERESIPGRPNSNSIRGDSPSSNRSNGAAQRGCMYSETTTTGWRAGCDHNADVVPCVVLDCFAGAGTTLLCADRLQRDAIGIELNVAYTEMAMERCRADAPLLHEMGPMPEHPVETQIADLFAEAAE